MPDGMVGAQGGGHSTKNGPLQVWGWVGGPKIAGISGTGLTRRVVYRPSKAARSGGEESYCARRAKFRRLGL